VAPRSRAAVLPGRPGDVGRESVGDVPHGIAQGVAQEAQVPRERLAAGIARPSGPGAEEGDHLLVPRAQTAVGVETKVCQVYTRFDKFIRFFTLFSQLSHQFGINFDV